MRGSAMRTVPTAEELESVGMIILREESADRHNEELTDHNVIVFGHCELQPYPVCVGQFANPSNECFVQF